MALSLLGRQLPPDPVALLEVFAACGLDVAVTGDVGAVREAELPSEPDVSLEATVEVVSPEGSRQ